MNAVVFVAAIVMVVIALAVLNRASGQKKRLARQDLKREKEDVGRFDILDLVRQELEETGAGAVPGGDHVDPTVLLRVWKRDEEVRDGCSDSSLLTFVVDEGIAPKEADTDAVRLVCSEGEPAVVADDEEPDTDTDTDADAESESEGLS